MHPEYEPNVRQQRCTFQCHIEKVDTFRFHPLRKDKESRGGFWFANFDPGTRASMCSVNQFSNVFLTVTFFEHFLSNLPHRQQEIRIVSGSLGVKGAFHCM